jgi:hypothetical protein
MLPDGFPIRGQLFFTRAPKMRQVPDTSPSLPVRRTAMRRLLLVLALSLAAAPLCSQEQQTAPQPADAAAVVAAPEAPAAEVKEPVRPSLRVTPEQIDAQLRQDAPAAERTQVGSKSWWYLVAAIAVGTIVALLLLD